MFLFFYLFNVSVCVFTKIGIKMGKGNLDRTTHRVRCSSSHYASSAYQSFEPRSHADHPLSVNHHSCILII
jgi:hypothetical protein